MIWDIKHYCDAQRQKHQVNIDNEEEHEEPKKIKLKANLEDSQNSSLLSSSRDPNWSKNLVDNIIPSFTGKERESQETEKYFPISILSRSYKRISVLIDEFIKVLVEEAEPQNPEDFIKFLPKDDSDPEPDLRHLMGYLN